MHGNNVVLLCAKYAVDANLFRLESPMLTRAKRTTSLNNGGGGKCLGGIARGGNVREGIFHGDVPGGESAGGNCRGLSILEPSKISIPNLYSNN